MADFSSATDSPKGFWKGALVRENSSQLIEIRLFSERDSMYGQYSIPELGLYEQPLREVSNSDSMINFRILYGPFGMRINAGVDQMTGINKRWNPPVSLHLKRFSEPFVKEYSTEELSFLSGDVKLAGTLIKPTGDGPFPGIVVVHGNGEQGRSEWEYRSHGYSLAKRGIAVFLYDKRGVGESSGDFRTVNFDVLADDAIAAMNTLRAREDIRSTSVGLLGVSQGGWISAIASGKECQLDFVIFLQGPAVSLEEQEFHRVKYSMQGDDFAVESIDSAITHTRNYFQYVNTKTGWDKLMASSHAAANSVWAEYVITASSPDDSDLAWWRNNAYDPADDLRSINAPVLSIFGEIDTAVPDEENSSIIEKFLTKAGIEFEIVIIPNMYHSVATYQGLYGGDMWNWPQVYWNWSRRPIMLDDAMAEWITNQMR